MRDYRFALALVLAMCFVGIPESSASKPPAALAQPPNSLVCQIAAVNLNNAGTGSIDVHPGYTIVWINTTYRYTINQNTKIINGTLASLTAGKTVGITARNGVALSIQIIGYVQ